jgi:hypothetical protein
MGAFNVSVVAHVERRFWKDLLTPFRRSSRNTQRELKCYKIIYIAMLFANMHAVSANDMTIR